MPTSLGPSLGCLPPPLSLEAPGSWDGIIPYEALLPAQSLTCGGFDWGGAWPWHRHSLPSEAMPGWRMHTGATWDGLHFFSNSSLLPIGSVFFQARAGLCFMSSFWSGQ